MTEKFDQWVTWIITGALGAISTGSWWIIRQVFTNQQQIDMMRAEIAHRDQLRGEDRERIAKIEKGVDRIETVLLSAKDK